MPDEAKVLILKPRRSGVPLRWSTGPRLEWSTAGWARKAELISKGNAMIKQKRRAQRARRRKAIRERSPEYAERTLRVSCDSMRD